MPVAAETEQPTSALIDLGLPSLKIRSGRIDEEWRSRLRGNKKFKVYRVMGDADATAGGFLHALQAFLLTVPWTVRPKERDRLVAPEAEFWAKRTEGAWNDMEQTPQEILAEVILHAARDGSAPMEVTCKISRGESDDPVFNSDFDDGMIAWRSWGIRPLESLQRWGYDPKTHEITSMVQLTEPDYRERTIPISKLLIFKFRGAKGSPEGVSLLSIAERGYYFKKLLEELEAIGAKRDLAGMPVASVPLDVLHPGASADKRATLEQMIRLVQLVDRNELEGVVRPTSEDKNGKTGFDFELMASSGSRQFDLDKVIRRIRGEMSVALGAAFMYAGMDGVGARSLDESKQDAFKLACRSILGSIRQTLDTAIVDLMRLNKVPRMFWPHFEHGEIDQVALNDFVAAINTGFTSGVLTHDDEIEGEYRKKAQVPARKTAAAVPMMDVGDDVQPEIGTLPQAAAETPAANTALNGAQVTSAKEIVAAVNSGELQRESAIVMLSEFFNLDPAKAALMVGPPPAPETKSADPQFTAEELRNFKPIAWVQETLGIGKVRVLQLVDAGELVASRVGVGLSAVWRFDPKSVHDYLASAVHDPSAAAEPAPKSRDYAFEDAIIDRVAKRQIPRELAIAQLVRRHGYSSEDASAALGAVGESFHAAA